MLEPHPEAPPLASDGAPGNPKRPRQFGAGGWGLYSGAGGPGGVQTRTRRISCGGISRGEIEYGGSAQPGHTRSATTRYTKARMGYLFTQPAFHVLLHIAMLYLAIYPIVLHAAPRGNAHGALCIIQSFSCNLVSSVCTLLESL